MYSLKDKAALLEEAVGVDKVYLHCKKHMYAGGSLKPPVARGCVSCCKVYFWGLFRTIPPEKRMEELEKLEAMVHHMIENKAQLAEIKFLPHADIRVDKEN